ncbi:MAG: Hsp70 family protein [Leptolyngbyaceae bacterium]|nr:Hsp70 family protein [Leptolyngbyaceae bacterium]
MSGIYAIDFGTSNTVVSRWNEATQSAEVLSFPGLSHALGEGGSVIPSLLYVEDAVQPSVLIGQAVRDRGFDIATNSRFFRNIKRGIGTETAGILPTIDDQTLSFEQVGQWFLTTILQSIQAQESTIESLTLTVPVNSFELYRDWLSAIMQSVDIQQIRMLDEPTAAALGYDAQNDDTILVVDCGGGTLDVSLVQMSSSKRSSQTRPLGFFLKAGGKNLAESAAQKIDTAKVLAKAGQNLGGADIDHWLVDSFAQTQGIPITPLTLRLAEKLKIALSTQVTATEVWFDDETLETYEFSMNREQFDEVLRTNGFFEQLDDAITQVFRQGRQKGVEPEDIGSVLLVGGTAQIPALQDWVLNYFPAEKIRANNPFGSVAQGALKLNQQVELKDFLYHGYGIRYWNRRNKCHDWHPIIFEGQPYPMETPVELVLGASADNQPSIELVLGELGAAQTSTEVYFDGDRLITRTRSEQGTQVQPLNDKEGARSIATLNPPGFPGSDRIKLQFRVDQDRFLRVTVDDLLTNERLLDNRVVVQLT